MRVRDVSEREALTRAPLCGKGHVDRQEAMKMIGRPGGHRRRHGARGHFEETAPVEIVQAAEQRLALLQVPRLHAFDMRYFSVVGHGAVPLLLKTSRTHYPLLEGQHVPVRQGVVAEWPVFGGECLLLADRFLVLRCE